MNVIFPVYPDTKQIDDEYLAEYQYAKDKGFKVCLVDIESKKIYGDKSGKWLYRGWMLSDDDFQWLSKNIELKFDYKHYLSFNFISGWYYLTRKY